MIFDEIQKPKIEVAWESKHVSYSELAETSEEVAANRDVLRASLRLKRLHLQTETRNLGL
jgi:hypothetical protein